MAQLTEEQMEKAEGMSLEQLKAMADKEELDNSGDEPEPESEKIEGNEPEEDEIPVYRKEILNDDGSTDVYEAESLEELVDKIAEGKRNANKKIKEFIAERKAAESKSKQASEDADFHIQELLKNKPKEAIAEVARQVLDEEVARNQRSQDAQSRFVNTHPDYVANPANGERMSKEVRNLGFTEFTTESLEKAYQSLKKSGLLILKQPEADGASNAKGKETQATPESEPETAKPRSSRSSTISTRTGVRPARAVQSKPTEDEAYKMPLDELRRLADEQLAEVNRGE